MTSEIYNISLWKGSKRLATIKCSILTHDVESLLSEVKDIDFGIETNKYTSAVIKYVERSDVRIRKHKIGYINKAAAVSLEKL